MPYYQHDFDHVEDYLHHRPPYLLVERIQSIGAAEIITEMTVPPDAFFIKGHFPGAPILPGAMMQELTTQSAGILIAARYNPMPTYNTHDPFFNEYALGLLVKITHARYRRLARPGDTLRVHVQLLEHLSNVFDFSASVTVDDHTIMRNGFQLMNVKSRVLQAR